MNVALTTPHLNTNTETNNNQEDTDKVFRLFAVHGNKVTDDNLSTLLGQITETYNSIYKKSSSNSAQQELFSFSKDDVILLAKGLFTIPHSSKDIKNLLHILQDISVNRPGYDETLKKQLQDISIYFPILKDLISVLLNPSFHIEFLELTNKNKIDPDKTLFQIVAESKYRDKYASTINIGNQISKALKQVIVTPSVVEHQQIAAEGGSTEQSPIHMDILQTGKTLLDAFKEDTIRNIRGLVTGKDEDFYSDIIDDIAEIRFINVQDKLLGTKKCHDITLFVPTKIYNLLEKDTAGEEVFKRLSKVRFAICNHYHKTIDLQYRVPKSHEAAYKATYTKPHTQKERSFAPIKLKPEASFQRLYNSYNIKSIPQIDYNKYFENFPAEEKNQLQNIITTINKPLGSSPTLCVSPNYDTSFVFAAINKMQAWKERNYNEKVIARSVPASQLSKLNQHAGQQYIAGNRGPNPFFEIQKYCDILVITEADEFLKGKSPKTFKWLFDGFSIHTILIASHDNIDKVPLVYKDDKNETQMRAPLAFSIVHLPAMPTQLQHKELESQLKQQLASNLFTSNQNIAFSAGFYTAIKTLSQGNHKNLQLIFQRIATICQNKPQHINEKDIAKELFLHFKQYKLFQHPIDIGFDTIFQVVAGYVVPMMQIHDEARSIGDIEVKDVVARYMAHLYLTSHGETIPFRGYDIKEVTDHLRNNRLTYNQTDIKNFKLESLQNEEIISFKTICKLIDTQIINHIMDGQIDANLSPVQHDPFRQK